MRFLNKEEFQKRILRIQEEMKKREFDTLMVYGNEYRKENIRYISNFWPIFEQAAAFIAKNGEPIVAGAPEGEKYAKEMSVWNDYRNIKEFLAVTVPEEIEYPLATFSSLKEILNDAMGSGKRLGIVGSRDIPQVIYERIMEAYSGIEIIPADDILEKMRLIKSEKEILCLKEAGRLACIAYEELMKNVIPGKTELYATGKAEGAARSAGAEAIIFTVFGSGKRADTIIGRPTEKIIEDGDMIMACLAVQYEGYTASAAYPFVAGRASDRQQRFLSVLFEASDTQLNYLREGEVMGGMVKAVRNIFKREGLDKYDIYPPLHGIGLAEAESPYPNEKTSSCFKAGMTVNSDISLFGHCVGSNRIEEGFVITKEGWESLTPYIRELCAKGI